jgi:hypothetical protein
MNNEDLQQLKALALGATAGPWGCFANEEDGDITSHDVIAINSGVHIASEDHLPSEETAKYIAAASPDVVLALIERIESLAAPAVTNAASELPPPFFYYESNADGSVEWNEGCVCMDDVYTNAEYAKENGTHGGKVYSETQMRAILAAAAPNAGLVALVQKAQGILAAYLPPTGPSKHDTITALLGLLDGPESRAALANAGVR